MRVQESQSRSGRSDTAFTPVVPQFVGRCDEWLRNRAGILFAAIVGVVAVWHSGFATDWDFFGFIRGGVADSNAYWKSSLITHLLVDRANLANTQQWINAMILIQVGLLALIIWSIILQPGNVDRRLLFVLIAISPLLTLLLLRQGAYDVLTISGGILVGLWARPWLVIIGAFAMILGNFEQSIIALSCLFVASLSGAIRPRPRSVLMLTLATAAGGLVLLRLAYGEFIQLAQGSRLQWQGDVATPSVLLHVPLYPFILYSTLGVIWLLVPSLLKMGISRADRIWLSVGVFGIPMFFTVINIDGTRIFGCLAAASLTAVLAAASSLETESEHQDSRSLAFRKPLIGLVLIVSIVVPGIDVSAVDINQPFLLLYGWLVGEPVSLS